MTSGITLRRSPAYTEDLPIMELGFETTEEGTPVEMDPEIPTVTIKEALLNAKPPALHADAWELNQWEEQRVLIDLLKSLPPTSWFKGQFGRTIITSDRYLDLIKSMNLPSLEVELYRGRLILTWSGGWSR